MTAYNLISTIGSFILGVGVLVTVVNVLQLDQERQAGRQRPLAGQHARVVHAPRRRRANNFDVIPRVRSVEPMKDIRREVLARSRPAETVAQPAAPRSL